MADAAAARREARRRRILENSHNRLQLISGKTCDEDARATPIKYQTPCDEELVITNASSCSGNVSSHHINGALVTESEMLEFLSASHNDASGDGDNEFTAAPSCSTAAQTAPTLWEQFIIHKYDILLLSLALQIMYSMNITPVDGLYFFLPVVTYIVMKLMLFPTNNQFKLGSVLMLINIMAPNQVQRILFILHLALMFFEDVCIFLFCTICTQAFLLAIKGELTI